MLTSQSSLCRLLLLTTMFFFSCKKEDFEPESFIGTYQSQFSNLEISAYNDDDDNELLLLGTGLHPYGEFELRALVVDKGAFAIPDQIFSHYGISGGGGCGGCTGSPFLVKINGKGAQDSAGDLVITVYTYLRYPSDSEFELTYETETALQKK